MDATFEKAPNLKKIIRFVYALLKSPFLNSTINADSVIYAQSLYRYSLSLSACMRIYDNGGCVIARSLSTPSSIADSPFSPLSRSGLEPRFLQRALYPDLSSWGAPNNLSSQNLPLSKATIVTSGCRLFLIDGYHTICAYHAPGTAGCPCPSRLPFVLSPCANTRCACRWRCGGLIPTA